MRVSIGARHEDCNSPPQLASKRRPAPKLAQPKEDDTMRCPFRSRRRLRSITLVWLAALAAGAGLLVGSQASADTAEDASALSFDAGLDFATAYFFRGFAEETRGFIVQPWAELGLNLFEGSGSLGSVDLALGFWNSVHSEHTSDQSSPRSWYEADLYAGLSFTLFEDWEIGVLYTAYTSPSSAFDTFQEMGILLAYDDSGLLGSFALSPYVGFFFGLGSGDGDQKYFEAGIEPAYTLWESSKQPVTLSLPVVLGLDMDRTYGNDTFGFLDLGLAVSTPLPGMPARLGAWEVGASVHYLRVGDEVRGAHHSGVPGQRNEVYGMVGLSVSF
jgi:hypothetical protein